MKKLFYSILAISAVTGMQSCNSSESRYVDLNTGETVQLEKDETSGLLVVADTKKPVTLYVDTKTKDTVWGKTGVVVNGKVHREKDSDGDFVYSYDDDYSSDRQVEVSTGSDASEGASKVKSGDYKKEVEKDGDITIKDGNKKIKIDGETGERKVKYDN